MVGRCIFVVIVGVAACSSTTSRVTEIADGGAGAPAGGTSGSSGNSTGGMAGETSSGGGSDGGASAGSSGSAGADGGQGGEPGDVIPTSGLVLWFDAERGIQSDGDAVVNWINQAGNGIDATQLVTSYQPTLIESAGKPALEFDGIDDLLELPAGFDDFSAGLSAFAVVVPNAVACMPVFQLSNGPETDDISLQTDENLQAEYEVLTAVAESASALQIGVPSQISALHQPPLAATLRVDGVSVGVNTSATLPQKVVRNLNAIGDGQYPGCQNWSGLIFEIILYDRALPAADLAQIEAYLREKWACCPP